MANFVAALLIMGGAIAVLAKFVAPALGILLTLLLRVKDTPAAFLGSP